MRVLVIGEGGREAALAWAMRQSVLVDDVLSAPGNAGIALYAKCMPVAAEDTWGLLKLAEEKEVDLTVVGPELPLIRGIVDVFERHGKRIIGPSAAAAKIEGSKAYAKKLFRRYNIPTADFEIFADPRKAKECIRTRKMPVVIKADGLAGGKGVCVAYTTSGAAAGIDKIMSTPAGRRIVIEEHLIGVECSYIGLADGENFLPLLPSLDYKKISRGSQMMTGGMGCVIPHPAFEKEIDAQKDRRRTEREKEIEHGIIQPLLQALANEGHPYRGILYCGLMITPEGSKLLEVNCRWGDPETQATLPLLKYPDFASLLLSAINKTNNLKHCQIAWKNQAAVCITLATEGYPEKPRVGDVITGLDEIQMMENVLCFHAGTNVLADGTYITTRGRVVNIVGLGSSTADARARAYEAIRHISFDGMWYRDDIGEFQPYNIQSQI